MSKDKKVVRCGIGILLLNDQKVLLGKRHDDPEKASSALQGEGTWTFPGGKCDFGETYIESAYRELLEETSIRMDKNSTKVFHIKDQIVENAHFLTIGLICENFRGEPKVMEPDEITEWQWFNFNDLPSPLYKPSKDMLDAFYKESYKTLFYS